MRSALRVIHIWAEHEDGDLLSLTPQHVIDTCMRGLMVKNMATLMPRRTAKTTRKH